MLSNHPNVLGGNGPSASSDLIGDVDGPASATDNAVARFDGTTGKLIQNSVVTISDTNGDIAGARSLTSPAATPLTLGTGTSGAAITVLSASNNVGIGTTTPNRALTVNGLVGINNGVANTQQLVLEIDASGAYFTSSYVGSSSYVPIRFWAGGSERILIASTTGDVSINSTTAGSSGAGALVVAGGLSAAGASYFGANVIARGALGYATGIHSGATADSSQQLILSSSGAYSNAYVSKNGTTLGIGFSSSNGSFVEDNALSIVAATKAATFAGSVSVGTGAAVGGATAGAGGLAFPASAVAVANANTLDDYEEGTWTPTVAGATTAGTVAYSSRDGYYTKIGRLLYVWFDVDVSSFSGGVGGLTITNLPFPNANISNFYPTFQPWAVASAYASTYTTPTGSINPNSSVLILYSTDDGHANFASMNVNQTGRIAGYLVMQTT